jgi:hypothetical protein
VSISNCVVVIAALSFKRSEGRALVRAELSEVKLRLTIGFHPSFTKLGTIIGRTCSSVLAYVPLATNLKFYSSVFGGEFLVGAFLEGVWHSSFRDRRAQIRSFDSKSLKKMKIFFEITRGES